MTAYTDRLATQHDTEVTHEQARAVCADLAVSLERAGRVAIGDAIATGLLSRDVDQAQIRVFMLGYQLAVDLVRETVLVHADPEAAVARVEENDDKNGGPC